MARTGRPRAFDTQQARARARDLFRSRGYAATSVQVLVDELGVQRGSLYAAFGDKHDLYLKSVALYEKTASSSRSSCGTARYCRRYGACFGAAELALRVRSSGAGSMAVDDEDSQRGGRTQEHGGAHGDGSTLTGEAHGGGGEATDQELQQPLQ